MLKLLYIKSGAGLLKICFIACPTRMERVEVPLHTMIWDLGQPRACPILDPTLLAKFEKCMRPLV
jgi:hypothetical protein